MTRSCIFRARGIEAGCETVQNKHENKHMRIILKSCGSCVCGFFMFSEVWLLSVVELGWRNGKCLKKICESVANCCFEK